MKDFFLLILFGAPLFILIYYLFIVFYFTIKKHEKIILIVLFSIAFFGTFSIYSHYYDFAWYKSFYYSLTQFTGDIKTPVEIGLDKNSSIFSVERVQNLKDHYYWLYPFSFLALLTTFLTILLVFFKEVIQKMQRKRVMEQNTYTLVIGLGENHKVYLESELNDNNNKVIVIEKDRRNPLIQYFEKKGVGIFIGVLEEYIDIIMGNFPEKIFISVGSDRLNIDMATLLEEKYRKSKEERYSTIYIHLDNKNYEAIYQQRVLSKDKDKINLIFRPYSFYDDVARNLFLYHTVLGNFNYSTNSNKDYNIILNGSGSLAERVLYHLCITAHLPNKNTFNIICIGKDAEIFLRRVKSKFLYIDMIKSIRLCALNYDEESALFYKANVWKKRNLTNIILCDDDENTNLERSVSLYDKVYLREAKQGTLQTKILFGMYHNLDLSETINKNNDEFKNFYTFGSVAQICSKEHLVNETHESLAQLIHYGYEDIYDIKNKKFEEYTDFHSRMREKILEKWRETASYSDRESNRSQALHIDTKLAALSLKKIKVESGDINQKLLEENIKVFIILIDELSITREDILEFSRHLKRYYNGCDFSEDYVNETYRKLMKDTSVLARLMKSEHERWNAFHYLNGWHYSKDKEKSIKQHDCLTDIELFDDVGRRLTVVYDLYSVIYLPSYLASTGHKIVPIIEKKLETPVAKKLISISIGVSGHRHIDIKNENLQKKLRDALKQIINDADEVKLISPLAEGSDRLFIDIAFEIVPMKIKNLTIPMPFEKDRYMKDFKKQSSRDKFEYYFDKSNFKNSEKLSIDSFSTLAGKNDDESYLNVGKCVVDKSDILVALWDGKKANGIGGTGDIVKYAEEEGKAILYINTETLAVKKINFGNKV